MKNGDLAIDHGLAKLNITIPHICIVQMPHLIPQDTPRIVPERQKLVAIGFSITFDGERKQGCHPVGKIAFGLQNAMHIVEMPHQPVVVIPTPAPGPVRRRAPQIAHHLVGQRILDADDWHCVLCGIGRAIQHPIQNRPQGLRFYMGHRIKGSDFQLDVGTQRRLECECGSVAKVSHDISVAVTGLELTLRREARLFHGVQDIGLGGGKKTAALILCEDIRR